MKKIILFSLLMLILINIDVLALGENINTTEKLYDVQIIVFDNKTKILDNKPYGKEYLDSWINKKVDESRGMLLFGEDLIYIEQYNNYVFWKNNDTYIKITSRKIKYKTPKEQAEAMEKEGEGIFPEDLIRKYLKIYPSECYEDGCPHLDKSIECIYNKFFLGYNEHTNGLFIKHNGFDIRCRDIVKYGEEGKQKSPELDYNQFETRVYQALSDSMYFSEEELEQLYDKCFEEGIIKIEGLPLDGFLKDCYNKVYPKLGRDNQYSYEEKSIRLCDNMNLIMAKNDKYFKRLKEARGNDVINQIIDFLVKKELERMNKVRDACENWEEGDEEMAECGTYERGGDEVERAIALKPCTKEDVEKGLDCTPVKKKEDKKIIEEDVIQEEYEAEPIEEVKIEEDNEKQSKTIFAKIGNYLAF